MKQSKRLNDVFEQYLKSRVEKKITKIYRVPSGCPTTSSKFKHNLFIKKSNSIL